MSSGAPTDAPAVRLDLVPAEVDAAVTGLAYPRDPGPDRTFGAQVGGDGRARVELAQAAGQTQLHALIAIGFDAADTIVSAGVLTDVDLSATPVRLIVELAPVARTRLGTGVPGLSAQVWGPDETAQPGCAGITTPDGQTRLHRDRWGSGLRRLHPGPGHHAPGDRGRVPAAHLPRDHRVRGRGARVRQRPDLPAHGLGLPGWPR